MKRKVYPITHTNVRYGVYLLGIGGIAMANLACLLKKKGYLISGSDLDTFGPSAVLLKKHKISYFKDHNPNHIKKFGPDIVVVGNAIKRGNPSLEYVLDKHIPYCSMPEIIRTEVIQGNPSTKLRARKSIVVTGTSGKTTTTALVAWILYKAGLKPTALIGGIAKNFNSGFITGSGNYSIVEGDEYGSSFDDSSPKFMHYQPYIALINNIRPDHLDVFGSIGKIIKAFRKLPKLIPEKGLLILNAGDKNSISLKNEARCKIETFGQGGSVTAKNIKTGPLGLAFELYHKNKLLGKIKTGLLGKHNVENILSASAVALNIGISFKKLAEAISTFEGVKRRLEIINPVRSLARAKGASPTEFLDRLKHGQETTLRKDLGEATSYGMNDKKGIKIIDDFAHNPDKVLSSLSALRSHFPKHQIIAIFEPRTGSSRRKFFQNSYISSFQPADLVYISEPYKKEVLDKKETFSSRQLAKDLNKKGIESYALKNADDIVSHVKHRVFNMAGTLKPKTFPTIFCIMSSGEFDGIHLKLISLFS